MINHESGDLFGPLHSIGSGWGTFFVARFFSSSGSERVSVPRWGLPVIPLKATQQKGFLEQATPRKVKVSKGSHQPRMGASLLVPGFDYDSFDRTCVAKQQQTGEAVVVINHPGYTHFFLWPMGMIRKRQRTAG